MNWEALGAISDFLAAIAVIITLGYLALQIRQNTKALKSTATQGAHDQSAAVYDTLANAPELGDVFVRGLDTPDTLSAAETARLYAFLMATMFRFQNWHLQTRSGLIERELLESWTRVLRQVSGTTGFQEFWRQRKHIFAPDFVENLEQEVFLSERDPSYSPLGVKRESSAA